MGLNLNNVQLNMIKELQYEPYASNTRATKHFVQVCAKYGADPQKVADAMYENYKPKNEAFKKNQVKEFEALKKSVEDHESSK